MGWLSGLGKLWRELCEAQEECYRRLHDPLYDLRRSEFLKIYCEDEEKIQRWRREFQAFQDRELLAAQKRAGENLKRGTTMANDRLRIRCKECAATVPLARYYPGRMIMIDHDENLLRLQDFMSWNRGHHAYCGARRWTNFLDGDPGFELITENKGTSIKP